MKKIICFLIPHLLASSLTTSILQRIFYDLSHIRLGCNTSKYSAFCSRYCDIEKAH